MTLIELSDEQAAVLNAKAASQGLTLEAWLRKLADETLDTPGPVRIPGGHIGEAIRARMSKVPPEIMATMPKDGASQHDHYIYGFSKREE